MAKNKKHDLYYLLPGMGKGAREKFVRHFKISILVGILAAGVMALVFYFKERF
jgi:hypothetical protein